MKKKNESDLLTSMKGLNFSTIDILQQNIRALALTLLQNSSQINIF